MFVFIESARQKFRVRPTASTTFHQLSVKIRLIVFPVLTVTVFNRVETPSPASVGRQVIARRLVPIDPSG